LRITAPNLGITKQAAVFEALGGDMLFVVADSTIKLPPASLTRIDLHRGTRIHPTALMATAVTLVLLASASHLMDRLTRRQPLTYLCYMCIMCIHEKIFSFDPYW
jgi:hypothetical protein